MDARGPGADRPRLGAAGGPGAGDLSGDRRRIWRARGYVGADRPGPGRSGGCTERGIHRPVKIIWSREESIIGHHKRHPYQIRTRWGATQEGKAARRRRSKLIADGGGVCLYLHQSAGQRHADVHRTVRNPQRQGRFLCGVHQQHCPPAPSAVLAGRRARLPPRRR